MLRPKALNEFLNKTKANFKDIKNLLFSITSNHFKHLFLFKA